jgi:hypothetical protein
MRNFLFVILGAVGIMSFSGCSALVKHLTDDSIKQNQQVVRNEIQALKGTADPSEQEHLGIAEKSAGIVGEYIGAPATPVAHDHVVASQVQAEGERAVAQQREEEAIIGAVTGWLQGVFPWLAPVLGIAGLIYRRSRILYNHLKAVVTGVYNTVNLAKDGFSKDDLYKGITEAAYVISNGKAFVEEVAKIKAEIKTNETKPPA